jgi:hypothetical protein
MKPPDGAALKARQLRLWPKLSENSAAVRRSKNWNAMPSSATRQWIFYTTFTFVRKIQGGDFISLAVRGTGVSFPTFFAAKLKTNRKLHRMGHPLFLARDRNSRGSPGHPPS